MIMIMYITSDFIRGRQRAVATVMVFPLHRCSSSGPKRPVAVSGTMSVPCKGPVGFGDYWRSVIFQVPLTNCERSVLCWLLAQEGGLLMDFSLHKGRAKENFNTQNASHHQLMQITCFSTGEVCFFFLLLLELKVFQSRKLQLFGLCSSFSSLPSLNGPTGGRAQCAQSPADRSAWRWRKPLQSVGGSFLVHTRCAGGALQLRV